ncbi:zinc finger CCCH-type with G patch domain-containing protein [Culex pipiens pallens]|uniref:zinc finger CCCH-type with G patch domain-containing protein n=1 Tax=Culex pipiens pallens TaxID=42434 RepID=UPI001953EEAD|nr:zinc finger CCCH-type with G patch domain-containing protein [Culex pipiens pallens]
MSSTEELNDSIRLYNDQLAQVDLALAASDDADERTNLESLKRDLTELLNLTRETLDHEQQQQPETSATPADNNDIDKEFALFMAEVKELDDGGGAATGPDSTKQDLQELVGSKCSAPHTHKWGSRSHHNALICSVQQDDDDGDGDNTTVKVLFINPTHQEMVPCAYYLEGECKFSDEKCRFSHGQLVAFLELKEYREPRFELLRRRGARVLAKQKSRLWEKGVVREADFEGKVCTVKLDESKREVEVPFEDVFPLESGESCDSDLEGDSGSEEEDDVVAIRQAEIISRSLLNPVPSQRLGDWEKHTKGMGSRIMQKMGYVVGAGLGCRGEGIVVPIGAQVLPQGRSLDYCMQLREKANGDADLFSVEKKLMRDKRIQEKRDAQESARQKGRKDVFSFINSDILGNDAGPSSSSSTKKSQPSTTLDLPKFASKDLNIASLKLAEQTRRLQAEVDKLTHSLKRHQPGTQMHSSLQKQLFAKRKEILQMQATEDSISREQQLRSDKRKMTVF